MAQVPYSGSPSVEASYSPTPRDNVNPSTAAFGGMTGAALTELGSSFSKDGDELFARAQAMQDLKNHSDAQKATSDYMEQAGKIHADFSALQGKDAVDAYPGYVDNLKKIRTDIGSGLVSPMAQKMYEAESLSVQGRTIFNGAGVAASQNKQYAIGAATARVQSSRNAALVDPTDEKGFQEHVAATVTNTQAQWQLKGADQETIDNATHKAVSDLWYDRITGLANGSQPFTALKMLTSATKDGKINGEDIGKLTSIVRDATHTVGARNVANEVNSGADLSWGAKPTSIAQAKLAIGTFESGNNYQSLGVQTSHGQALGRYQVMEEYLPEFLKQSGLPSMTSKEFLNSPTAQDKVFESVFGKYMTDTGSFNDAASKWFSGKTVADAGNAKDANGTTVPGYLTATNGILAKNASLTDKIALGRTLADKFSPNDPLMGDYAEHAISSQHNLTIAAKRDDDYRNRQTVESALIGGNDQSGKLPTSPSELKSAGPEVEAAWQKMPDSDKRRYMAVMAQTAKGNVAMTEDRLREYQRLKGLAYSDPGAFLDADIVGADLPMNTRKELVNLQQQKLQNADQDPRMGHALEILRPTLDSAQISRKTDTEGYDRFVGGLDQAMKMYQQDNMKPPQEKDIQLMGQRLIQTEALSRGLFGRDTKAPLYNVNVPDTIKDKIVTNYKADNQIEPTDLEVQKIYQALLYKDLFSKKSMSGSKPQ